MRVNHFSPNQKIRQIDTYAAAAGHESTTRKAFPFFIVICSFTLTYMKSSFKENKTQITDSKYT